MARWILIDNNSGYIFADSGDLDGPARDETPIEFAARFDATIHEYGRTYEMLARNPRTTVTGYDVYRADIDGTEAVALVYDGQDNETIQSVITRCSYEGFIICADAD